MCELQHASWISNNCELVIIKTYVMGILHTGSISNVESAMCGGKERKIVFQCYY